MRRFVWDVAAFLQLENKIQSLKMFAPTNLRLCRHQLFLHLWNDAAPPPCVYRERSAVWTDRQTDAEQTGRVLFTELFVENNVIYDRVIVKLSTSEFLPSAVETTVTYCVLMNTVTTIKPLFLWLVLVNVGVLPHQTLIHLRDLNPFLGKCNIVVISSRLYQCKLEAVWVLKTHHVTVT